MFTKKMAEENRKMEEMALSLLGPADVNDLAKNRPDIIKAVAAQYPDVPAYRIVHQVAHALRANREAAR